MRADPVTLPAENDDAPLDAFAAVPANAKRGVVVVHDLYGMQPENIRVAERFARAGYAAVAPDLFAAGSRIACIRAVMRAAATGEGPPARAVVRARQWLAEAAAIEPSAIGLIGFCLTGGFVLGVGRGWGAVSTNYGDVPGVDRLRGVAPVIGCYGGRDRIFTKNAEVLRRRLDQAEASGEVHVFPSAGHSFLTDGDHPVMDMLTRPLFHIRYDAKVADEAWSKIFAFFDRHLDA